MNRLFYLILFTTLIVNCYAGNDTTNNKLNFKFYGQIRGDLFYNTRANEETVDGLFYMYPKDYVYDEDGKDLNSGTQGNFYVIYTRLGVDLKGVKLGKANVDAKIEADFRGSGSSFGTVRLRQAYVQLGWNRNSVLVGQTWHPLFGEVSPSVLNLSTGAPFQPFNRSPLIRYRYMAPAGWSITSAAIWQAQFNSVGPDGKNWEYLKNSSIPEIFAGVDWHHGSWLIGAGVEMLSLRPRNKVVTNGKTFKVNERVTSFSAELHARYKTPDLQASVKTILANNLTHCSMIGGFGVTSIDERTGKCSYTPFRHSMTWINFTYGKKWQPGIFAGYLKNLGTSEKLTGATYGTGLDVDQVVNVSAQISFNLPHWRIGIEATPCWAWYGNLNMANGLVKNTHSVSNFRILGVAIFKF